MATDKSVRRGRPPPHDDVLAPTEWAIAQAVKHGMSNREIARPRGISADAVKFHVGNALSKLGFSSRQQLRKWFRIPRSCVTSASALIEMALAACTASASLRRSDEDLPALQDRSVALGQIGHRITFSRCLGQTRTIVNSSPDIPESRWASLTERSNSFDHAILSADRRSWHPLQVDLFSLDLEFDIAATPLLPPHMVVGYQAPCVVAALDSDAKRTHFINETVRIHLSDILWGERAALAHAARLCLSSVDMGAQENAAIQAREEARHVAAFSLLIARRWGAPVAPTPVFAEFLESIATAGDVGKEIAGMQVLVEGLAMGIFAALEGELTDPLCCEVIRLVMADEASHLKTGATWMARVLELASSERRAELEAWTAQQFTRLSRGLFAPTQRPAHYAQFDLDPRQVGRELRREGRGRLKPSAAATIFCTAAKAIHRAGLIGPASKDAYAGFI